MTGTIRLSRRAWLAGALGAWAGRAPTALADVAIRSKRRQPRRDTLVVLFLRGGADGLNIVAPYAEDAYHRLRPSVGLSPPNDRRASARERLIDLDGFFGLHPALAPLAPLYHGGSLAFIHACGSGDRSHSHFEAMAAMEQGDRAAGTGPTSGWLARHLAATAGETASPLRGIAFGPVMPDSLRGATGATAIESLDGFRLAVPGGAPAGRSGDMHRAVAALYRSGDDAVSRAGRETIAVLDAMSRIDPAHYRPEHGASYPIGDLGNGLKQAACLIKARLGLEVACLDRGGWDTHVAQGGAGGWMAIQLDDLGKSLAAFARDLGPEMKRVTVVAMSEFGRRAGENSGLGTDHGRGGVMTVMGGGVAGGRVFARWPGLEDDRLEPPGDLQVTTDYRDVLAEILSRRLANDRLEAVFPGYAPRFVGIARSAV